MVVGNEGYPTSRCQPKLWLSEVKVVSRVSLSWMRATGRRFGIQNNSCRRVLLFCSEGGWLMDDLGLQSGIILYRCNIS